MNKQAFIFAVSLFLLPAGLSAQSRVISLDDCRQMALESSEELQQARTEIQMAGYDRKIARAYYLPNVSATGMYLHNSNDLLLIHNPIPAGLGSSVNQQIAAGAQSIMSNPVIEKLLGTAEGQAIFSSEAVQSLMSAISRGEAGNLINGIRQKIDELTRLDVKNVYAGGIMITEPVFAGGKIMYSNKVAKYAEELQKTKYEGTLQEVLNTVDQSYWQVVSVANKKKLAEHFSDLLHKLQKDVEISVKEGVATESDYLQIKVKVNEADILLTQARNGLVLSKMLLCKQIGLPLESDITLADEDLDAVPEPQYVSEKPMENIYADRVETRSLDLATKIFDGKAKIERAEMLPTIALMGSYIYTNPNLSDGFQNKFSGMASAGVVVKIPIFHGGEALYKTKKARAEASLYSSKLEDAHKLIRLQVTQLMYQQDVAWDKVNMTRNNLASAAENLRTANVGFEAGVINANTVLAAHAAWLKAQSEFIDAGVELQMNNLALRKAQGEYYRPAFNE